MNTVQIKALYGIYEASQFILKNPKIYSHEVKSHHPFFSTVSRQFNVSQFHRNTNKKKTAYTCLGSTPVRPRLYKYSLCNCQQMDEHARAILGKEVSFVGKPTPLYPHLTQRLFKKNPI
jgi:hypothetical protein